MARIFDRHPAITMISAGMVGAHFRLIAPFMGFQLFALGFLLSILGSFVGLLAVFLTRKPQLRAGRNRAVMGLVVCLVIAVPVIATIVGSASNPAINDITTDFDNPPEFVNAQKLHMNRTAHEVRQDEVRGQAAIRLRPDRSHQGTPFTGGRFARVTEVAKPRRRGRLPIPIQPRIRSRWWRPRSCGISTMMS